MRRKWSINILMISIITVLISTVFTASASSEIDAITLDGYVTPIEWQGPGIELSSANNNNISYAVLYEKNDFSNNTICLAVKVSEYSKTSSNSRVKFKIGGSIVSVNKDNDCCSSGSLSVNAVAINTSTTSYSVEILISGSNISSKTPISVCLIDCHNVPSNKIHIDLENEKITTDVTTTTKPTSKNSVESTTKKPKSKTTTKTKKDSFSRNNKTVKSGKSRYKSVKGKSNGKSNKTVNGSYKSGNGLEKPKNANDDLSENYKSNAQKSNTNKYKKIIFTIIAVILVLVAIAIPIISKNKKLKEEINKSKESKPQKLDLNKEKSEKIKSKEKVKVKVKKKNKDK